MGHIIIQEWMLILKSIRALKQASKQVVEQESRYRNSTAALISFSLVAYFPQAKTGDFFGYF